MGAPWNLDATIADMRDRANQLGLVNLPIGVDEGGILSGPDNRELAHSVTGMTWQGSWMALLAATTLGAGAETRRAEVRAEGLKASGNYRLVVQSYDAAQRTLPNAKARPLGSMQRAVTAVGVAASH